MNEIQAELSETAEAIVQSVITEAIERILMEPSNPATSGGHYEIRIDEPENIWLSGITGQDEQRHLLEIKLYSMKPGNDEARVLGLIDLKENRISDENGEPLDREQLQNLKDCIELFPGKN